MNRRRREPTTNMWGRLSVVPSPHCFFPPWEAWVPQLEDSHIHCQQVWEAVLQNNTLAKMQIEFLTLKISHHVPQRIPLFNPPSSRPTQHWPCLHQRQDLKSIDPIYGQFIFSSTMYFSPYLITVRSTWREGASNYVNQPLAQVLSECCPAWPYKEDRTPPLWYQDK